MNRLSTYVLAIHSSHSQVRVVAQSQQQILTDNSECIEETTTTYTFDNGVKIVCHTELDSFQSEDACPECWIQYQVLESGSAAETISPQKKQFYNRCQETFWLKMQSIRDEPNG
ncbi:hypothetical protein L1D16_04620 [Vibrio sp. Isolate31]|uniref:hypothetical protein n=1 Tax=unclassified Vibrio TaxID=2614977 RepID=UPI001EFD7B38|nr:MULTISPECIES: hypothetical protein [unclassified Vibrio]MCG9552913.1 hypothetical protein [Vibrio sp. Isolate32]MCG9600216.1 hypothetical protein [Vibrio sp. Isolate31]